MGMLRQSHSSHCMHATIMHSFPRISVRTAFRPALRPQQVSSKHACAIAGAVLEGRGVRQLAPALRRLELLRELDLSDNGLPQASLLLLVRSLPALTELRKLWLIGNDQQPAVDAALRAWSSELAKVRSSRLAPGSTAAAGRCSNWCCLWACWCCVRCCVCISCV